MNEWDRTRQQAEDECSIGRLGWAAAALVALIWLAAIH